jgi:hypothetical protein
MSRSRFAENSADTRSRYLPHRDDRVMEVIALSGRHRPAHVSVSDHLRLRIFGDSINSGSSSALPKLILDCLQTTDRLSQQPRNLSSAIISSGHSCVVRRFAHARASEYSWCNPPSIAFACTEQKSSSRCRDFDNGTGRVVGGSGTPGPNAECGRPRL